MDHCKSTMVTWELTTFCPGRASTVASRREEVPDPDVVVPYSRSSGASTCVLRHGTGKRIGWLEGNRSERLTASFRDASYRRRERILIFKPRFQKLGDRGLGAQGYVLPHIAAVKAINTKDRDVFVCQTPARQGQESNRDVNCAYKHGQLFDSARQD